MCVCVCLPPSLPVINIVYVSIAIFVIVEFDLSPFVFPVPLCVVFSHISHYPIHSHSHSPRSTRGIDAVKLEAAMARAAADGSAMQRLLAPMGGARSLPAPPVVAGPSKEQEEENAKLIAELAESQEKVKKLQEEVCH